MNQVLIVGALGRDPEINSTSSGKMFCNLSVATNESVKKGDVWEKTTEWHRITLWGKQAENAGSHLKKGSKIAVIGKLQTKSFEKDGKKQYKTEIVANSVDYLSPPKGESTQYDMGSPPSDQDAPF